ncbi:CLUMA_CG005590, isoform A [Clunio marinus]|uniref:Metalloendopeptidase n=1 Tax=Clunio marinus TaxID=568069 RepID=A0A1J1HWU7_9DIPT|nr:CLUMA_CG005590, isoform A [Clunio marinus]
MTYINSSVILFFFILHTILGNPIAIEDESYEYGDNFQGDIILSEELENDLKGLNSRRQRTGLIDTRYRWPKDASGNVIVPYTFDSSAADPEKNIVVEGLRELEAQTCIKFIPRTNEKDYVEIMNGSGCSSYLGRRGGKQTMSLKRFGCVHKGVVIHEFIHALGYTHIHNHVDRDKYVTVNFENIPQDKRHNFVIVNDARYGNYNTEYDFDSIMHYSRRAFSSNGLDTIVPHDTSYYYKIGQRSKLSLGDVTRIRNMYQCHV